MRLLILLTFLVSCGRTIEKSIEYVPYNAEQIEQRIAEIEAKLDFMQTWDEQSNADIQKLIVELETQLEELKRLQTEHMSKKDTHSKP